MKAFVKLPLIAALLASLAAPATVYSQTWNGSTSNSWGTATNWSSSPSVPVSGGSLIFTSATGAGGLNLNNNLTSGSFNINAITYNAGAAAFVIGDGTTAANSGNAFVLVGTVTNNSTSLQTINNPFSMTAARTFTGSGSVNPGGNISGTGGAITKTGAGALTLSGSNSFTGGIAVQAGSLNIGSAGALGTGSLAFSANTTFDNSSGSALTLTTNNAISLGGSPVVYGGANDLNFGTGSSTIQGGGGLTLNGNARTVTFGGTVTNSSSGNSNFHFYQTGGDSKVVLGGFSLNASAAASANSMLGNADVTITGAVVGGGNATASILVQGGTKTLTLQENNTAWSGTIRASNSGTVKIDGSTATMSGSNALELSSGGTISYDNTNSSSARTVSFGALGAFSASAGEGTFQSIRTAGQNVTVTLANLTRAAPNVTMNIVSSGGTNGTNNTINVTALAAGFVNGGIFFNGANFAAMNSAGGYLRELQYGTDALTAAENTITAATHVKLTSTQAAQNTISLRTLNLSGSSDFSLNASQTLTLSSFGLLKSGGGSSTVSGGSGISQGASQLILRADSASDLLTIANNISTSAVAAVTKSGAGTVVLTGTSNFSGANATLTINNGALRATDGTGLPSGAILQLRGGVFESSGNFTRTVGTAVQNVN